MKTLLTPLNIILLGDPAAGKATQAGFIVKKYKLYDFDMGQELNRLRNTNLKVDRILKAHTDKGNLTPTHIVREILQKTILKIPLHTGILFDGHPKMLGEAQLVSRLLAQVGRAKPLVLYLSIPMSETIARIQSRKGYFSGKYGKRADDSVNALQNRVKYYRKNVAQVISFFKSQYIYKKISGLGDEQLVWQKIDQEISKLL